MPDERTATTRGAIVIPVKAFDKAKERLATILSAKQRTDLARHTATRVIEVARSLEQFDTVYVVCDDEHTAHWANQLGTTVLIAPTPGLNAAVEHACAIARQHHDWIVVCHADVADPAGLANLQQPATGSVTLIADRHELGTNVVVLNSTDEFTFRFGPTSFARHQGEARQRQLTIDRRYDEGLALDLDTPSDIALLNCVPTITPDTN
jgi:2-phospho-L-lactate guanylyltransferase